MNEEEIINRIKYRINELKLNYAIDNLDLKAMQGLLDLYNQEKEKNKELVKVLKNVREMHDVKCKVIDLMAIDNALLCTDYEFGCFYEKNAECMKGPVRNCKECITEYYFKKARGEEDVK